MSNQFINFLLNKTVVVKRRADWTVGTGHATRDVLNAPNYGTPSTWTTVYAALKCRIEYKMNAPIQFKPTGERVPPPVVMFIDDNVDIRTEDRIFDTENDEEWIVEGRQSYYNSVGGIHHYEYSLLIV